MAVSEEVTKQFIEFVMTKVYDDQFLDRQEEKNILEEGIKMGMGVEEGLSIIEEVCFKKGFIIERKAEDKIKDTLETFATNDGKVDEKEFKDALEIFKKDTKGKILEPQMKRQLKKIMEENGWKAKEGGIFGSKWYSAIK